MKKLNSLAVLALSLLSLNVSAQSAADRFVDQLLSKMTVEEKIAQLNHPVIDAEADLETIRMQLRNSQIGSFCVTRSGQLTAELRNELQRIAVEESRLGIPVFFAFDVIHGYETIFPIPLAMAASWDEGLLREASHYAAMEAKSNGIDMGYAPMVDVSRDARWGRISESSGEDVLLNSRMGVAVVQGFQGEDLSAPTSIISCVKHFVGYGASMGGRDKQFTEISDRSLHEIYLPPFKACVDAGARAVMTAFNDISGVPASANPYTLTDILREQWHFDGVTISDWDAVIELINHGVVADEEQAAHSAFQAGVDLEMRSKSYEKYLKTLIDGKEVPKSALDEAVRRVLRLKYDMGLFENPYARVVPVDEDAVRSCARKAAAESMVLLKNNGILPLDDFQGKLSVQGPYAVNRDLFGWWTGNGDFDTAVPVYDGLVANAPDGIRIELGTNARQPADIVLVCVGESGGMFGETNSVSDISLSASQVALIREAKQTGKSVVTVIFNGRPLALEEIMPYSDAILMAWHPGHETGNALADVLFGKVSPSGKLPVTLPRRPGHIPMFYSDRTSGRPQENYYKYEDTTPLFPFGYGLSYSDFEYSALSLSDTVVEPGATFTVNLTVENTGEYPAKEIVQLYVKDLVASVTRPRKQLIDFRKLQIDPGEKKTITFDIDTDQFALYRAGEWILEPGRFEIMAGPDSEHTLSTEIIVKP